MLKSIFTELDIKEYIYIDAKETLARNNNAAAKLYLLKFFILFDNLTLVILLGLLFQNCIY